MTPQRRSGTRRIAARLGLGLLVGTGTTLAALSLTATAATAAPAPADVATSPLSSVTDPPGSTTSTTSTTGTAGSLGTDNTNSTRGTGKTGTGGPSVTPNAPVAPKTPGGSSADTNVNVNLGSKPSSSIVTILALTLLAVAPALLLMCTSFTKIIVVLSLTRNALGLQSVPPNQVLAGLALFLTLFVMSPVLSKVNADGIQPYLKGQKTQSQAFSDGMAPLHDFMAKHTRTDEITMLTKVSKQPTTDRAHLPLTTLIPAFVLSELRSAFVIGFVIFIPFLVIDLVVSSSLMSMGMMMLPPVMISLPFKLLLFLMVDGWALVVKALVNSYG